MSLADLTPLTDDIFTAEIRTCDYYWDCAIPGITGAQTVGEIVRCIRQLQTPHITRYFGKSKEVTISPTAETSVFFVGPLIFYSNSTIATLRLITARADCTVLISSTTGIFEISIDASNLSSIGPFGPPPWHIQVSHNSPPHTPFIRNLADKFIKIAVPKYAVFVVPFHRTGYDIVFLQHRLSGRIRCTGCGNDYINLIAWSNHYDIRMWDVTKWFFSIQKFVEWQYHNGNIIQLPPRDLRISTDISHDKLYRVTQPTLAQIKAKCVFNSLMDHKIGGNKRADLFRKLQELYKANIKTGLYHHEQPSIATRNPPTSMVRSRNRSGAVHPYRRSVAVDCQPVRLRASNR